MKLLRFLWRYASRWKGQIFLSLAALTFVSLTSLLYPWLVKNLVDHFETGLVSDANSRELVVAIILVLIASTALGYYQQTKMNGLGIQLRNDLREAFYESLLARPLNFYRQTQVGELSAIATEELAKVQPLFTHFLAPLYQNTLFIIGCLCLMVYLNWLATIVVMVVMLLPLPSVLYSARKIPRFSIETQLLHSHAHALFEETLVAIREVKGFLRERLELKRYSDALKTGTQSELAGSALRAKISQSVYLLLSLVLLAVFFVGANKTLFPGWTIGGLIAFYFYAYMMTMSVIAVERIYVTYQNIAGALDRVMVLLAGSAATINENITSTMPPVRGKIEFEGVTFTYSANKQVLHNVSFVVDEGSWCLVTGPSGSGKSTLMNLIMGFYEVGRGRILIDGVEVNQDTTSHLRRHIGFVGQDPFLVRGTLRENIAFAEREISDKVIEKALQTACLVEVVQELPNGLDTIVGERGYTMSGGQKARVAIARAIVSDPAILILDEANAMLESELEQQLWTNLIKTREGKTTLILTHHAGNIPRVNKHFELADGTLRVIDASRFLNPLNAPPGK